LAMCNSTLVPAAYRGKDNLGNVLIAMQMANRIGADPMSVMQNLHVIQGKPSLSSSFLIATVNACGRFEPIRFEVEGEDPAKDDYRVRAYAADKKSGVLCQGTWITWAMVKAEGWSKKPGSKWLTMPGQMFLYRAAAFWARIYAPEVSLGIHTAEEVQDVWGSVHVEPAPAAIQRSELKSLESRLLGQDSPPTADADGVLLTVDELKARFEAATNTDELDDAYNDVSLFEDPEDRKDLHTAYELRRDSLELQ
jgi:hypothetical protein